MFVPGKFGAHLYLAMRPAILTICAGVPTNLSISVCANNDLINIYQRVYCLEQSLCVLAGSVSQIGHLSWVDISMA